MAVHTPPLTLDEVIDRLTLFDDTLMSMVFDGNIKAAELFLRIVLEKKDIKVNQVVGQRDLESPLAEGRGVRLDIWAEDSTGRQYDIEVQRENEGASFQRARFNSSMLDARMLKKGQKFQELRDSYVIFLTEKDVIGAGKPLYHIGRTIAETGDVFADGSHIVYVNGQYHGDDPIGRLIHDFKCRLPEEMYYADLSAGVEHFKNKMGGRKDMCQLVEDYANQKAAEAERRAAEAERKAVETERKAAETERKAAETERKAAETERRTKEALSLNMLRTGEYTPETIAALTGLPLERIWELQAQQ